MGSAGATRCYFCYPWNATGPGFLSFVLARTLTSALAKRDLAVGIESKQRQRLYGFELGRVSINVHLLAITACLRTKAAV